jgi:ElaB/YqjD/DUF883 family membrane-anchored ribosome-binding protein
MDKFENTSGAVPKTEFERSIARAASADPTSRTASKVPPLVDGRGSALNKRNSDSMADDQLEALKVELENIKQSVAKIAATARGVATEKVDVTIADVEEALRKNVFASVGVAALIGYLWGRTR